MTVVQQLDNEMRKELRRQRVAATEQPAVADALLKLKQARQSAEVEHRLAVRDANKRGTELTMLKRANELLRKRKHAMKRYSPEALGQGKARSGGVAARMLRYEVLDKMAKLGTGLYSVPEE